MGQHEYRLKVDASSKVTWLQCKLCLPQAKQYNPVFDGAKSPTFQNITGTSNFCKPPLIEAAPQCAFHVAGPGGLSVHGYVAKDYISQRNYICAYIRPLRMLPLH